jgi:hypothetical protein
MRVPAGRSVQEIDSAQFGFYSPRRQDGRPSLVLVFLNGGFPSDVANTRTIGTFWSYVPDTAFIPGLFKKSPR